MWRTDRRTEGNTICRAAWSHLKTYTDNPQGNDEKYWMLFRGLFPDSIRGHLIYLMDVYLCNKVYNTQYGDLVPPVIANALHLNVLIITEGTRGPSTDIVHANVKNDVVGDIIIYKSLDHYDGITSTSKSPKYILHCCNTSADFKDTGVVLWLERCCLHRNCMINKRDWWSIQNSAGRYCAITRPMSVSDLWWL